MNSVEIHHGELLPDDYGYTLEDVCVLCHVERHWVISSIEHGVIEVSEIQSHVFSLADVERLTRALRMQREFELQTENIALVLDLMDTIEHQRSELQLLRRQALNDD